MDLIEFNKSDVVDFEKRHPWEIVRSRVLINLIKKEFPGTLQHITDIGSGDAYLAHQLFKNGVSKEIAAIDTAYTSPIKEKLQRQLADQPIQFFTSLEAFSEKYTLPTCGICLFDVLEHIGHPSLMLQQIKSTVVLKKTSLVFITVPAFQRLFSEHDKQLGHQKRYSRKELLQLMSENGYTVINSGYFFFTLLLARGAQTLLEKSGIFIGKKGITNWNKSAFTTNLFVKILWADFKISNFFGKTGIRLPGLSCYCICQPLP